jgi:hypothetical protein
VVQTAENRFRDDSKTDWQFVSLSSTAPKGDIAARHFRVTHPFHPLFGREFELEIYKNNWGEDRMFFHLEEGHVMALPVSWTDLVPHDPFVAVAAGRSLFRAEDLWELAQLVGRHARVRPSDV